MPPKHTLSSAVSGPVCAHVPDRLLPYHRDTFHSTVFSPSIRSITYIYIYPSNPSITPMSPSYSRPIDRSHLSIPIRLMPDTDASILQQVFFFLPIFDRLAGLFCVDLQSLSDSRSDTCFFLWAEQRAHLRGS